MALDFKTMSTEKKIFLGGAAVAGVFGIVSLILSFCVYGSVASMIEGEAAKMAKAFASALSGGSYEPGNPLGTLNWALILTFIASLGIAAVHYFKAPKIKLIPENIPLNIVVPAVIVLTFLFVWLFFATSKESAAFLDGKGTALGIFALLFLLAYTAVFALAALEDKDDIKKMLPNALLALGGLLLIIAVIRTLAYPGMEEAAAKAFLKGKDSIPSPLGLVKLAMIINSLAIAGWGCLHVLEAKDEA